MHILFFSHYFPPEGNAPASRTYEHCVRWVRSGHRVTVITGVPNVPHGRPYDGYKNRFWPQREKVDGIDVIRVWTVLAPNAGFLMRILNYVSFMLTATIRGIFVAKPDVIIATSPQFFCGWAGVLVQAIRRKPFILEIRDIWPESIEAVGAMRKGLVIRLLQWMERRMYAAADRIVAVGHGYAENVGTKTKNPEKISVIYNGVDGEKFQPNPRSRDFLTEYGFEERFVCAYVGTIGMAHGLGTVLDAAEKLRNTGRADIAFLLVGDGARREYLEQQAANRGLTDMVQFTGLLPKSKMPEVLSSCDCLLVHLRPCELFETVIPSKIFEAMAMCRPMIMGVRGESAEIVEQSGGGITMEPGNAESLLHCVTSLKDDPQLYCRLQQRGREFVLQKFSRDRFAADFLKLLRDVAGEKDCELEGYTVKPAAVNKRS